jgi:hypothetical protein
MGGALAGWTDLRPGGPRLPPAYKPPPRRGMKGDQTMTEVLGGDGLNLASMLLIAFNAGICVIGYFLKRLISQNDAKIELLRSELNDHREKDSDRHHEIEIKQVAADALIKQEIAEDYVPQRRCDVIHQGLSETHGRLFQRLDDLDKDVAGLIKMVEVLMKATEKANG